jgi:nitroreductase
MDLSEAIYARRAVREFTNELVPEGSLRRLVAAAIQAPNAANHQSWSFTIVRDKTLLAHMSREVKAHMRGTSAAGLVAHYFEDYLSDPDFNVFYNAPALIVISSATANPWAIEDCSLAAENLMLAAHAIGLGTCWVGITQRWFATPEGKAALNLPVSQTPVAPIIVGHSKSAPPPISRGDPKISWIGT